MKEKCLIKITKFLDWKDRSQDPVVFKSKTCSSQNFERKFQNGIKVISRPDFTITALLWGLSTHLLIFALPSSAENAEESKRELQRFFFFPLTVLMICISIRHNGTILPQLCHYACRLLNICIKISIAANEKPTICLHTRDHPTTMTNLELCSLTLWGQLRLLWGDSKTASGSRDRSVGTLIDGKDAYQLQSVLQTPNCNWSPLLYH